MGVPSLVLLNRFEESAVELLNKQNGERPEYPTRIWIRLIFPTCLEEIYLWKELYFGGFLFACVSGKGL